MYAFASWTVSAVGDEDDEAVLLPLQVRLRPAFARKLAGSPVGQTAAQPLRNGKRNGVMAAASSKSGAGDGSGAAGGSSSSSTVAGSLAVVSLGEGLLAALMRVTAGGQDAAGSGNSSEQLLLGPVSPSRQEAPLHSGQRSERADASDGAPQVESKAKGGKAQKRKDRAQQGAAMNGDSAGPGIVQNHGQTHLRVTVLEGAYGCAEAVQETAVHVPENGRLSGSSASFTLQVT